MPFGPHITAEEIRQNRTQWKAISREAALGALRSRLVVVIHGQNGFEAATRFDESSPFYYASGPYDYAALRYFFFQGSQSLGGTSGRAQAKAKPAPQEELEPFDFPTEEFEAEEEIAQPTPRPQPGKAGLPFQPAQPTLPGNPALPTGPVLPGKLPGAEIPAQPALPNGQETGALPLPSPELPGLPDQTGIPEIPGIPAEVAAALAVPGAFAVRVVDELGEPIDAVEVVFTVDGKQVAVPTRGGKALFESPPGGPATVAFKDPEALRKALLPRLGAPGRVRAAGPVKADAVTSVIPLVEPLASAEAPFGTLRTLSVQPKVARGRIGGLFFETSKTFLLPGAAQALKGLPEFTAEIPGGRMLVVGHADRAGSEAYNDVLSFDRAEAVVAFLRKEPEGWLKWYGDGVAAEKRWGAREDRLMLAELGDGKTLLAKPKPFLAFQESRGLEADDIVGPETRGRLVKEYMDLVPAAEGLAGFTAHGCGENFPSDATADGQRSAANRQAELFLFDGKLGIQPPPPGKNSRPGSKEYPEWKGRATAIFDITAAGAEPAAIAGARLPMRFSNRKSFPKPHILPLLEALAERLAEDPALTMALVGHADAIGTDEANKKVSLARAEAVKAWICRDRKFFLDRFQDADRKTAWDWEEVQWMLHGMRVADTPCYIGQADGFPGRRTQEALGRFQVSTPDLPPTHVADRATLERLVDAYLDLLPSPPPEKSRITALGGGNWHPPQAMGSAPAPDIPEDSPDRRRVDAFLFKGAAEPPVEAFPADRAGGPQVYDAWCGRAAEEIAAEDPKFFLELFDPSGLPLADTTVLLSRINPDTGDVALGSLKTSRRGTAEAALTPGMVGVGVQLGQETFTGSFLLDIDESCGAALSFNREGGMATASGDGA